MTGLMSALMSVLRSDWVSQIAVISGRERRRRWTIEERRLILSEAFAPGACVAHVARRHDVSTSLIYTWRRNVYKARAAAEPGFAEAVMLEADAPALVNASPVIVVDLSPGNRVSIFASAPSAMVAAALAALR